ncbi:EamA family transporter [Leeia sp. TBRC 13508]|uniref:EamA family transporter n=1 Tax=Leeia speluncae TaxID=2884804 RepID=A0ABS8D8V9_9NEIS|nr:EamA family transporter [Leeia speluncae]MCB6184068.1 EamA family transporter [Leeia speluncae]
MSIKTSDILLTAIGPVIWGSTYLITTELLPPAHPLTAAVIRVLPIGILLALLSSYTPPKTMWPKLALLSILNIAIFQALLFVAAYRLPGGVAATLGAIQPIVVGFLSWLVLQQKPHPLQWLAALGGILGVALMVLKPDATLDSLGILAALIGAATNATGTIFTRKWCKNMPIQTLTAWQLWMGGLMLLPFACLMEYRLDQLTIPNYLGYAYLAVFGSGIAYTLWFRGIQKLTVTGVTMLALLSPVVATILGFAFLQQAMNSWQLVGGALVLASVVLGQFGKR